MARAPTRRDPVNGIHSPGPPVTCVAGGEIMARQGARRVADQGMMELRDFRSIGV
jgi:hypothetical protein